ncbi:MAG: ABC transporter ATP-binding protein [bacterium]
MASTAICVENLGKKYRIGSYITNRTLRESIVNTITSPLRKLKNIGNPPSNAEIIWALKDISFNVAQGEVVGIIGRNGAGKTTILKILSRITKPTKGRVILKGRVVSLLEVGTGFHPELTGHENIYLNGAILGMDRYEISKKFDEIVAFAEIEKFLHTPVKRYSSGMYIRLAFAVAAHLEPEILLIDEVLAVGDAAFQKKCLGKMNKVANEGRTVLFVSHNMEAIQRLCPRSLLIADGHIQLDAPTHITINAYLTGGREKAIGYHIYDKCKAPGDEYAHLKSVKLTRESGLIATIFKMDENININIHFIIMKEISNFHIYIRLFTQDGILAFASGDWDDSETSIISLSKGEYLSYCIIPGHLLNRGIYFLTVIGEIPHIKYIFVEENVLSWEVVNVGGAGGASSNNRPGIFRPKLQWRIERLNNYATSQQNWF